MSALNSLAGDAKKLFSNEKAPLFIIIGLTIILFVIVILYITFQMKSKNMQGKLLNDAPINLGSKETPTTVKSADIPLTMSGREYSYGFWLYLETFNPTVTVNGMQRNHKIIMYRGAIDSFSTANPIIFMDAETNKLYVIIRTTNSSSNSIDTLDSIITNNFFTTDDRNVTEEIANKHLILSVDYVPLQRWVNVTVVVDNKIITLYVDGELYSVKSVDEFKAMSRIGNTISYNLLVDKTDGDLQIGKSPQAALYNTIDGYIGKIEFFNYAVNASEVKKSYEAGPIASNWLSWFGINQYGIRSPVYKLTTDEQN